MTPTNDVGWTHARHLPGRFLSRLGYLGKGQMGSALMGSLQSSCFLTGTFWVLPLIYFYLPKSARAYLFPQSVKNHDFCSGPISVDPICLQPNNVERIRNICPDAPRLAWGTANLRTMILDFRGFDSSLVLIVRGWNSQAHREFPGSLESANLSREILRREIGRSEPHPPPHSIRRLLMTHHKWTMASSAKLLNFSAELLNFSAKVKEFWLKLRSY